MQLPFCGDLLKSGNLVPVIFTDDGKKTCKALEMGTYTDRWRVVIGICDRRLLWQRCTCMAKVLPVPGFSRFLLCPSIHPALVCPYTEIYGKRKMLIMDSYNPPCTTALFS